MSLWLVVPLGICTLAFIVFAFRQGMQVTTRQEGDPPERTGGGTFLH
jgi:hypothetical protein